MKPETTDEDDVFVCERCGEVFTTNAELQAHRRKVHGAQIDEALERAEQETRRINRM